jgi:hypothetical protein
MRFGSRRFHAVLSYWLNSSNSFYFNRINKIYKRIAAINLADSSGNPIVSQTKQWPNFLPVAGTALWWES